MTVILQRSRRTEEAETIAGCAWATFPAMGADQGGGDEHKDLYRMLMSVFDILTLAHCLGITFGVGSTLLREK